MIDLNKHKLELDYPCSWKYKLVVLEDTDVNSVVKEIVAEKEYTLKESNASKKGKFKSYSLDLIVHNEEERKMIFEKLGNHKLVKMVL